MAAQLPPPKPRSKFSKKTPAKLPIPLNHDGNPLDWPCYQAIWKDGIIIVPNHSHAEVLWKNGYFGLGELSQRGNEFAQHSGIINSSSLDRRKNWAAMNKCELMEDDYEESEKLLVIDADESFSVSNIEASLESDPFPFKENMELTAEESLFLSYAFGCLILSNTRGKEMDIDDMWKVFMEEDDNFYWKYIAYHYFRSRGWVVKPGLKFGCDFVLYPVGPPHYHSQYSVIIRSVWDDNLEISEEYRENYSITDFSCCERLASQVGKNVILCDIIRPRSLNDLMNISCINKIKVLITYATRWLPDEKDDDIS